MPDGHVVVLGAGLAGLVAAATVRERGVDVVVHEAGPAPGGASIESAGWIWRYRDAAAAAVGAPTASPVVAQLVLEHLDRELEWLEHQGTTVTARSTGRTDTVGVHVDPRSAIDALVHAIGPGCIATGSRIADADPNVPTVLATGGYAGDFGRIAAECGASSDVTDAWVRRPSSASTGEGLRIGIAAGGSRSLVDGQCLVRVSIADQDRVREHLSAVSELLVPGVVLLGRDGAPLEQDDDWSHARMLRTFQVEHGAGTLVLPGGVLDERIHSGVIRDVVAEIERATGAVRRMDDGSVHLSVRAGITHTWCGLDVDHDARVVGADAPVFAAGCDAAGSGHGGTASGLAQALVLGRRAGASAARAVLAAR